MGYSLHIERTATEPVITLEEWRAAVQASAEFRFADGDHVFHNPRTRERITISNSGGDVEVLLPSNQWARGLSWGNHGAISFRAELLSSHLSLVRPVFALAQHLNAVVVGDDGEEYTESSFDAPTDT